DRPLGSPPRPVRPGRARTGRPRAALGAEGTRGGLQGVPERAGGSPAPPRGPARRGPAARAVRGPAGAGAGDPGPARRRRAGATGRRARRPPVEGATRWRESPRLAGHGRGARGRRGRPRRAAPGRPACVGGRRPVAERADGRARPRPRMGRRGLGVAPARARRSPRGPRRRGGAAPRRGSVVRALAGALAVGPRLARPLPTRRRGAPVDGRERAGAAGRRLRRRLADPRAGRRQPAVDPGLGLQGPAHV
ncbi:MAG: hypothetical protein AVDCRST_MAG79-1947, partial [uncultured Thermoleophilia bacterium]